MHIANRTLPALTALKTRKETRKGRRALLFIEKNGAARFAIIKGKSSNEAAYGILTEFWELVAEWNISVWADRMPSCANPADGPPRGDVGHGATAIVRQASSRRL